MQQNDHDETTARELLTVKQFARRFPAWTESALRALIYAAEDRIASGGRIIKGNGLRDCGAIVNVGRRVLLNVQAFFGPWIAAQQKRATRKAA